MTSLSVSAASISRSARQHDPLLVCAGVVCLVVLALAVLGPWLAPYPPDHTDILAAGQGPSSTHLFGTDSLGRDILSRLMTGARLSVAGAGLIVFISMFLGTSVGMLAAWFGGTLDAVVVWVSNVFFAVPGVLAVIVAAAVIGPGFWAAVIGLALVYTPFIARVARSALLPQRRAAYVEALELSGMSAWRVCSRHLLRNIGPLLFAQATVSFGSALMDFGAASFLGVGVQAPAAEWGVMISDGRGELLDGALQQCVAAGLMIVIAVVAFNVLGDRLTAKEQR